MGRGRAKAKQAKVARELKYTAPAADFDALQRELSGRTSVDSKDEDSDHDHRRLGHQRSSFAEADD